MLCVFLSLNYCHNVVTLCTLSLQINIFYKIERISFVEKIFFYSVDTKPILS